MRTVVLGPLPEDLQRLIERRRALGQDGYDEMWNGEYHMAPMAHADHGQVQASLLEYLGPVARQHGLTPTGPFNLGLHEEDFRVPDGGFFLEPMSAVYVPTAAIVVEVLSPDDETFDKFGFYRERGVQEIIVADPAHRLVQIFHTPFDHPRSRSALLQITAEEITAAVAWPPVK